MSARRPGYRPLGQCFPRLADELAALARQARPTDLLSLNLPLAELPWPAFPAFIPGPDSMAWQRPEDAWLALGAACTVESAGPGRFTALHAAWQGLAEGWRIGGESGCPGPLAHLGFAFYDSSPADGPLPNARLRVPSLLLRKQAERHSLTLSCPAQAAPQAMAGWEALWQILEQALWRQPMPETAPRLHRPPAPLPDRAFLARTQAALAAIARGDLDKVVLSRRIAFHADAELSPAAVYAALGRQQPASTVFAVGHRAGAFLGATPERLLSLRNGRLETEALAGTGWGAAEAPLGSEKNRREHGWVAEAIQQTLAPLCAELRMEPAEVLHLPLARQNTGLSHLRTPFRGCTAAGIGLFDLAARLHPTPAVGGWPAAPARDWLQAHGEERPLWYSGGLGWIDPAGNGTLAVPLRCADLRGPHAELQAGAGIVAGSSPEQELAETEAKLAAMLDALHAGAAPAAAAPDRRTGTE
ncbi:MAG TPA: isochorismate synthase [Azospira sp.]|nr:isochorismate synthase [Azospira sp.]